MVTAPTEVLSCEFPPNPSIWTGERAASDEVQWGPELAKQLIGEAMVRRVAEINPEECAPGDEDAFFVADLGEVYRLHKRWTAALPRVQPFYAVKCNPDDALIRLLGELGTGFDCASKGEVDQILKAGLAPERIIYAQPCKTPSYLRHVRTAGVKQMTFDNTDELHKIARYFPEAELYLRIATDDTSSLCRLSMKFGAHMDTVDDLLALACELRLNVVGVSFHVGSGASDPLAFRKAVCDARHVFDRAKKYAFHMHTLDVGGGFVKETFDEMSAALSHALDVFFPVQAGVRIIAEPGRFFSATAFTLACHVIARRTHEMPDGKTGYMLYMNDGVYGNFSSIMFDHQHPVAKVMHAGGFAAYDTPGAVQCVDGGIQYSIWGPTCDGIDCISKSSRFDAVLDVGDWLYFEEMGAYTKCSATQFNGFTNAHDTIYVCSDPEALKILGH